MSVRNYTELIVWQKSILLVEQVYSATRSFPSEEIYGLTSQVRRAAVSIPSNIAEGQARKSTKEFKRFLSIALGSNAEVETQLIIAQRLDYIKQDNLNDLLSLCDEIKRMAHTLITKLN
ncbi:MAG: four helix bundle protein [Opitutaceae bacterium]